MADNYENVVTIEMDEAGPPGGGPIPSGGNHTIKSLLCQQNRGLSHDLAYLNPIGAD
jgi:hypothetical protein